MDDDTFGNQIGASSTAGFGVYGAFMGSAASAATGSTVENDRAMMELIPYLLQAGGLISRTSSPGMSFLF
jgi:hypothetical protein